jgi:hypothetical protein
MQNFNLSFYKAILTWRDYILEHKQVAKQVAKMIAILANNIDLFFKLKLAIPQIQFVLLFVNYLIFGLR